MLRFGLELGAAFLDRCAEDPELARRSARGLVFLARILGEITKPGAVATLAGAEAGKPKEPRP